MAGCSTSGSPTDPGGGSGGTGLAVTFGDGGLSPDQQATVLALLRDAFNRSAPRIPIDGTRAEVSTDPARVIPGWGVGGFARGPNDVLIVVDPTLPEADLEARLPPIAAHEYHHAARFRGPGYGNTLLQALVSEGLADRFSQEVYGPPRPPWVRALPPGDIPMWMATAAMEFDSTSYDFDAWFFGTGGEIPRWTGYTLGWALVGDYLAVNPGSSAAGLVHADAERFRPD